MGCPRNTLKKNGVGNLQGLPRRQDNQNKPLQQGYYKYSLSIGTALNKGSTAAQNTLHRASAPHIPRSAISSQSGYEHPPPLPAWRCPAED